MLFYLPIFKTIHGMTADEIINKAGIIQTKSNDYLYRCGELDLALTDDNQLVLSGFGGGICRMDLTDELIDRMETIEQDIEQLYIKDNLLDEYEQ